MMQLRSLFVLVIGLANTVYAAMEDCPGYTASNVVHSDTGLTADLQLANTACNVYGRDLDNLQLMVEYQTSEYMCVWTLLQSRKT